ncbi:MAG TPA: VOC family protein [Steroidobacteraceae bacterium]|jgi:lactoylglutathione lyase
MRIEHVAFWTADIERLSDFYATYFGATAGPKYINPAKAYESRFLTFEGGARIELMYSSALQPVIYDRGAQRMGLTHLAIAVGSKLRVDDLTSRLRQGGFEVVDGPRHTGDGYYESVVLDPDGNRIEVTV